MSELARSLQFRFELLARDTVANSLVEVPVRVPIFSQIAIEITTMVNGLLPVGSRPLDPGISNKRDGGAVALQVLQVGVEEDHAFAGVASAAPIPVGVVTANRPGQAQCGTKVINRSGLYVVATEDCRFLPLFR